MSEIEIVTEIMMGVAALCFLVWTAWYLRRLEREAAAGRKSEGKAGDSDVEEGDS